MDDLAQTHVVRDDRVVEVLGIAHAERFERGEDLRPRFFIQSGRHEADPDAHSLEFQKEILHAGGRGERAFLAASLHDLVHFAVGVLEIVAARLVQRSAGAVFVDAVLQMLRHRMAGHERDVAFTELELRVAQKTCDAHLDDPDPEFLRTHRRAVEIHQHGADGIFRIDGQDGVVRRERDRGFDAREGAVAEGDELDFLVAGGENVAHAVLADGKAAVLGLLQHMEPAVGGDVPEVGDVNGFGQAHFGLPL